MCAYSLSDTYIKTGGEYKSTTPVLCSSYITTLSTWFFLPTITIIIHYNCSLLWSYLAFKNLFSLFNMIHKYPLQLLIFFMVLSSDALQTRGVCTKFSMINNGVIPSPFNYIFSLVSVIYLIFILCRKPFVNGWKIINAKIYISSGVIAQTHKRNWSILLFSPSM